MRKKELVSMFMESPFYFELTLRERLFLLKDHRRRFGKSGTVGLHYRAMSAAPLPPVVVAEPDGEGQCFGGLYPLPAGAAPTNYPLPGEPQIKRVEP